VGQQVVEDDGVTGHKYGHGRIGHVGTKACAVGGSVEQGGGAQNVAAQGVGDTGGLVVPVRDGEAAALALRLPTLVRTQGRYSAIRRQLLYPD
jgi:hypothetical protein